MSQEHERRDVEAGRLSVTRCRRRCCGREDFLPDGVTRVLVGCVTVLADPVGQPVPAQATPQQLQIAKEGLPVD